MLDRSHRLTSGRTFARTIRRGRRAGAATLMVHLAYVEGSVPGAASEPARVGLVVSKAVGNAVTRNRVKRRLRHLVRDRLARLPQGSLLVIRALPAASTAPSATLGGDLDAVLDRVLTRGSR